ncbi:probable RNA-dependent RNA polymerase 5 isoform X4, partial [Fagus crenata]
LCVSEAADSWLALMDRLLILGNDCIEEKDHVKANILQLIDIYYDALDAPKKGGQKWTNEEFELVNQDVQHMLVDLGGLKDLLSDAVQLMKRLTLAEETKIW